MKKTVFIIVVIFLSACAKESKSPDYVIPQDKMVNIITDIHIMDGLNTMSNVRRKLAKDSISNYDVIFTNYGYSRSDFDTSIYFYSKNIDQFDKIYEDVLNKLNEMETIVKQESVEEEAKKEERRKKKEKRTREERK
jgi:hypothetical protein